MKLHDVIAELRLYNKYRRNYIRQRVALENRMKGMIAAEMGYDPSNGNETEIFDAAKKVVDGLIAKKPKGELSLQLMMQGFVDAHKVIKNTIKSMDSAMAKLAKHLPIFGWSQDLIGMGPATLAKLVAEMGGINNNSFGDFDTVARAWKRMGLAVMPDGQRQRKVKGDAAIAHGYDCERRSEVYQACQWIIMKGKETNTPLYAYYVKTKERVRPRCKSDKHADLYAKRLMGKKLIKWMWREWNQAAKELQKAA
jgi:hypothetical protein